jgi:hypothetical protein
MPRCMDDDSPYLETTFESKNVAWVCRRAPIRYHRPYTDYTTKMFGG